MSHLVMLGLIWIQTLGYSDDYPEIIFLKGYKFWKISAEKNGEILVSSPQTVLG